MQADKRWTSVVAVNVSVADRGNRTPEIVRVFRFEHHNIRVGHSHLHKDDWSVVTRNVELSHDEFCFPKDCALVSHGIGYGKLP